MIYLDLMRQIKHTTTTDELMSTYLYFKHLQFEKMNLFLNFWQSPKFITAEVLKRSWISA